ncbi:MULTISPECIES: hypothetical protein [unclassified Algibacter]|uniref:hypothetical protein n=1 Tax=unclassified Algibacter TaxID=2615009 RepID=UPI00131BBF21|nr:MULTISPECIES: hypothetical protein [unclassified Algibacter]MCL5127940.1 hypothetical protein [Algibacter sp. L4_22]
MRYSLIILTITLFCFNRVLSQVGYQKDSLQIKVYAAIDYVDTHPVEIKVKKVFCDYCTEFQIEKLSEEAYRRTFLIRNDKNVRLTNGTFKHALYIRVSKKDLAGLKREDFEIEEDINPNN